MNGGEGQHSYAQNSCYQGGAVDAAKSIIEEEIAAKLDISSTQAKPAFVIADFGCSTGHNSFPAIQIITEAIEKKLRPEFQVFFNDQEVNDFNTLFRSLPPQRNYHAAGVPGSFHGRLFPKASLDFAYFTGSPECPRKWKITRIRHGIKAGFTTGEPNRKCFKLTSINLFVMSTPSYMPGQRSWSPADPGFEISGTSFTSPTEMQLLGSCLMDMANKGIISEEKVDTFNLPLYCTIPEELKAIIERNNSFGIERMEVLAAFFRAVFEEMLVNHFGSEVVDEIFDRYANKLEASPHFLDPANDKSIFIFLLLKRKPQ